MCNHCNQCLMMFGMKSTIIGESIEYYTLHLYRKHCQTLLTWLAEWEWRRPEWNVQHSGYGPLSTLMFRSRYRCNLSFICCCKLCVSYIKKNANKLYLCRKKDILKRVTWHYITYLLRNIDLEMLPHLKNFYTQNQSQRVSVTIVHWYLIILKCCTGNFLR